MDFAKNTRVIVKPEEATQVADAIVRVYIERNRRPRQGAAQIRARRWGMEKFIAHVEELGRALTKVPADGLLRPAFDRFAHIGVHKQKQAGLNWIGAVFPVGKATAAQMRGSWRDRAGLRRRPISA